MSNPIDGTNKDAKNAFYQQEGEVKSKKTVLSKHARSSEQENWLESSDPTGSGESLKRFKVSSLQEREAKAVKEFYLTGFDTDGTLEESDFLQFLTVGDTKVGQGLALLHGSIQHHGHSSDPDDPVSNLSLLVKAINLAFDIGKEIEWSDDIDLQQTNDDADLAIQCVANTILKCIKLNSNKKPKEILSKLEELIPIGLSTILSYYSDIHFDEGIISRT